jgi:ankyrin repeat protein
MDLYQACEKGNLERVKAWLDFGVGPYFNKDYALKLACEYGHIDVVKLLLQDKSVNPTSWDNCCIRWASRNGYTKIVKLLLLDGRVDPTADNEYAIKHASFMGYTEIVSLLLLDGRVDPTADNEYAIIHAKTQEIKEMLIKYKYRVDGPEYQKLKF